MEPFIVHRVATTAVMPLVAAGGWAGYDYYDRNYPPSYDACFVISTTLEVGDRSPEVRELQEFLLERGYLRGTPTGYFGETTRTALYRFQRDEGLPQTGYTDRRTRDRVESVSCDEQYPDREYPRGGLVLEGVDAPRQLSVGQTGTWTVRVSGWDGRYGSRLHYSVRWGDEAYRASSANTRYGAESVNSSGSFTHVYGRPGTYTQVFTVTDDQGNRVEARTTVTVSGYRTYDYDDGYRYDDPSYRDPYGCASYYDRNCWAGDRYVGPTRSNVHPYNGPSDYYSDSYAYDRYYTRSYADSSWCAYDRSCSGY